MTHASGPTVSGAIPKPATNVTGPDIFGAAAVIGTGTKYARNDHDHGLPANPAPAAATTVVGPGVFGGAKVVGTDTTFAREDHWHGLPGASGFVAQAAGGTTYWVYFDGANYQAVDMNTGVPITNAVGATLFNGIVKQTAASNIVFYMDPSLGVIPGTVTVLGNEISFICAPLADQDGQSAGFAVLQWGATNLAGKVANCYTHGLTVNEVDFLPGAGVVQMIVMHDTFINAKGGAGGAGIVFDGTGGGFTQYCAFTGHTWVKNLNTALTFSTYGPGWLNFTNGGNGNAHLQFDTVDVLDAVTGVGDSGAEINFMGNATANQFITIQFNRLDVNQNNAGAHNCVVTILNVTRGSATQLCDVMINELRTEVHGTGGFIVCNESANGKASDTTRLDIVKYFSSGSVVELYNAGGVVAHAGGVSSGLYIHTWVGKGAGDFPTWGSLETATFPMYVGNMTNSSAVMGTGTVLATPANGAAGSILSPGGGNALVNGDVYTCGGTPLIFYMRGATGIALATSDGTAITPNVTTGGTFYLTWGMTITATTWGTTVVVKAV